MLLALTSITDFVGLCTALWLAGYLFSRGFRSATTIRAVVILLLLAGSFIEGYISLHEPPKSHNAWYIAANLLAVLVWYNLTFQWLPGPLQRRLRWVGVGIYAIGLATIVMVLLPDSSVSGPGPGLMIGSSASTLFVIGNAVLLLPAAMGTIINFWLGARHGRGPGFQAMWLATLFGALAMPYGALAYMAAGSVPRVGLDWLVYAALLMLGLAVARHQAFVERRTTLQDLPVTVLAIVAIMAFYAFATQQAGFSAGQTALVTALAVATHSVYEMARELLDRWVHRQESELRHQLRKLARDVGGPDTLPANLQTALNSLVNILRANGGFVAVKQGDDVSVLASVRSLPVGVKLEPAAWAADSLRPGAGLTAEAAWLAPTCAGNEQLGALGLGPRTNRSPYSEEDLDLLVDAADAIGQLLQADAQQAQSRKQLMQLAVEVETREVGLQAGAHDLIAAMESQLDRRFERLVEQCLQHLSDYLWLGQSGLAAELLVGGATHIERGKMVREALLRAMEGLRPAGARPSGTQNVSREWHAYTILHEAYVEDVPNRDIMAKLYVSEGTFNRQRRKALHAVARTLVEARRTPVPSDLEGLQRTDPPVGA